MKRARHPEAGTTLIEILIAVTLLSLLSVGILMALRVGISAMGTANTRLMENRRVAGAQRIIEEQVEGLMPVVAPCAPTPEMPSGYPVLFFQGEPQSMRFVSTFSLQEAWRGTPHILEFQVIPGENGHGVRLIVNEIPYTGPLSAGSLCVSRNVDPATGRAVPRFLPIAPSPRSFVLADRLASCHFAYLEAPVPPDKLEHWRPQWTQPRWPLGIHVEIVPLDSDPVRLRPVSITAKVHVTRVPEFRYADQ